MAPDSRKTLPIVYQQYNRLGATEKQPSDFSPSHGKPAGTDAPKSEMSFIGSPFVIGRRLNRETHKTLFRTHAASRPERSRYESPRRSPGDRSHQTEKAQYRKPRRACPNIALFQSERVGAKHQPGLRPGLSYRALSEHSDGEGTCRESSLCSRKGPRIVGGLHS